MMKNLDRCEGTKVEGEVSEKDAEENVSSM